jgi:hypothetical protein
MAPAALDAVCAACMRRRACAHPGCRSHRGMGCRADLAGPCAAWTAACMRSSNGAAAAAKPPPLRLAGQPQQRTCLDPVGRPAGSSSCLPAGSCVRTTRAGQARTLCVSTCAPHWRLGLCTRAVVARRSCRCCAAHTPAPCRPANHTVCARKLCTPAPPPPTHTPLTIERLQLSGEQRQQQQRRRTTRCAAALH